MKSVSTGSFLILAFSLFQATIAAPVADMKDDSGLKILKINKREPRFYPPHIGGGRYDAPYDIFGDDNVVQNRHYGHKRGERQHDKGGLYIWAEDSNLNKREPGLTNLSPLHYDIAEGASP
ncbi:hypothetical protein SERLA73DRAFT_75079 [Serpula lacrymans var. lacrymans S7.3]|uniref:Uncharacterized protein n=2 Tax=Serpula lacrymans var. lacrymans TaxID=341189 RepID=F8Q2H8_SERL3|nr:uncharacterized protein SERLADRAFT_439745 [Serpula lacrymans var. lacrymans S7.9]EGN97389.1 hypothetical protein SERLA73DRAFT_75079 [Serpula lacrymans var. lacrymans S7.3]EGO22980.1 hypothetical protein SERLADRAFT_439745 [Serpula lacrymans var. lacrymans S7.9]